MRIRLLLEAILTLLILTVFDVEASGLFEIPTPRSLEDIALVVGIALALLIGVLIILKSIRYFVVNTIVGFIVLFLANTLADLNIAYTWLVLLICAIGGFIGAVIVIVLHLYGVTL